MQIIKNDYWATQEKKVIPSQRRDYIEILAEMVYLCKEPKTKTSLMRQNNLSYRLLKKCIDHLLEQELIEFQDSKRGSRLISTKKGDSFLKKFSEIQLYIKKQNPRNANSIKLKKLNEFHYSLSKY